MKIINMSLLVVGAKPISLTYWFERQFKKEYEDHIIEFNGYINYNMYDEYFYRNTWI